MEKMSLQNYARDQFLYFLVIGKSELATQLIAKKILSLLLLVVLVDVGMSNQQKKIVF